MRVNAIAPGWTETDFTEGLFASRHAERLLADIPLGRWARTGDVTGAAVYLASAASDYVTGTIHVDDGGRPSAERGKSATAGEEQMTGPQDDTLRTVSETAERYRNWGRWGEADERGTLNFVTPADIVAAARLVRSGKVCALAIPFYQGGPQMGGGRFNPIHTMAFLYRNRVLRTHCLGVVNFPVGKFDFSVVVDPQADRIREVRINPITSREKGLVFIFLLLWQINLAQDAPLSCAAL